MIILKTSHKFNKNKPDNYTSLVRYYLHILRKRNNQFRNYVNNGHYSRVFYSPSASDGISVNIIRIKIPSSKNRCGFETHAVFLSDMLPYVRYTCDDVISVTLNNLIPDYCSFNNRTLHYLCNHYSNVRSADDIYNTVQLFQPVIIQHITDDDFSQILR